MDTTAQRKVIDNLMADNPFFVDQEEPAIGNTDPFNKDVIVGSDGFAEIGDQGIGDSLDTALFFGGVDPCQMRKVRIHRTADDLDAPFFKLGEILLEGMELRRTDEGKIKRIEKEDHLFFPLELREGKIRNDFTFYHGIGLEIRGRFANKYTHNFLLIVSFVNISCTLL